MDGLGNVTVAGYSVRDLAVTPDAMQARRAPGDWCGSQRTSNWPCADAFVMKLNASGTALLYGSMLGGNSAEDVQAIALDSAGNAYITGVIRGYGYFHGSAPITFPNTVPVFDSESFFTAKFMSGANQTANPSVHVSAASFLRQGLAPESIATAFGTGLATATAAATSQPLPTMLAGTTVKVGDQLAPLFYVSPAQVNYLVPAGIAFGTSVPVVITNSAGATWISSIKIDWFTPGLFTANADGHGLAAALAFRVKVDGSQSYEPLVRYDATTQRFVPVPLDLGAETDRVYLVLFGTGWRAFLESIPVSASIGSLNATVVFAGAQPGLTGVDQANVLVPRALLGRGEVEVSLTFLQQSSNTVRVVIK